MSPHDHPPPEPRDSVAHRTRATGAGASRRGVSGAGISGIANYSAQEKIAGKRVLFVINSDSAGGVEHLAQTLSGDLAQFGAIVQVLFLYPKPGAKHSEKLYGIVRAARHIVTFRPDMVITFQPTASVIAMVIARLIGCRARIVHESNMPLMSHPVPRHLDRLAGSLGFFSVNIMNSAATENAFIDYPKAYRERFRRIPHGVTWHKPVRSRQSVRDALGVPHDARMLLTCARLSRQKSLDTILRVLPALPDAYFVIAGDGGYEGELKRQANELGVSERTRFLGRVAHQQLFELHRAADLFVFPSVWETFGIAAVEAAISGLPIVASDIAPTREVLAIDGTSPLVLVEDWTTEKWLDAIQKTLNDPDIQTRARAFGDRLRDCYSVDEMLARYRRLYVEVLS